MSQPERGDVDPALRERLDRLSGELDARKPPPGDAANAGSAETDPRAMAVRAMSIGFRAATEIVAAVVVGAFIGWQLDRWLGSGPLLLIVFFFLGTAAGFLNLYRTVERHTRKGPSNGAPN
jgi:ATP synthase protein I